MAIKFRPHHFLCALCFQGRGYSPTFVSNFQVLMAALNGPAGDAIPIEITPHTDSICEPCPHRNNQSCTSEEKIQILDHAHAEALALQMGDSITWGAAKKLITEKITLDKFHTICATCSWKEYGICESVLNDFLPPDKTR